MATYTQQLLLELLVKSDQFSKELKQVGSSTKEAEKSLTSFRESAGKALSFAASAGLSVGVISTIKKTTQAYGEFINQQATAQQVFGDSYGKLTEQMENSVEAFGQSQTQFLKSTTLIAGLGKTVGLAGDDLVGFSTQINKLGADLAAAFNTSTVDAINAIQSGFSGSSIEPLRKYNIVLSDTILKQEYYAITGEKVTGVLTQQQRMVAFLSKLYKESADYQGQWDRESQQFQGTMQRLQATMGDVAVSVGSSFEPAITAAGNALIGILGPLTSFNEATGGLPVVLATSAAAFIALRGPMTFVGAQFTRTAESARYLSQAVGDLASTRGVSKATAGIKVLGASMAAVSPLTIAAGAAIAAYGAYTFAAAKRQDTLNEAMDRFIGASATVSEVDLKNLFADAFGQPLSNATAQLKATGEVMPGLVDNFKQLAQDSPALAAEFLRLSETNSQLGADFRASGLTTQVLRDALADVAKNSQEAGDAQEYIDSILNNVTQEVVRNEKAWDNLAEGFGEIAKQAADAQKAIEDLTDSALEGFTDQLDVETTRAEIGQAIVEWAEQYNAALGDGETLQQRQITNLENEAAIYEAVASNLDAMVAARERETGVPLVGQERVDFIQAFIDQAKEDFPLIASQLDALAEDVGAVEVQITANSAEAQAAVDEFIGNADLGSVGLALLVDSGLAEAEVNSFISAVGKDKFAEITAKAIVDVAEDDISKLDDTEYVADVLVDALVDDAVTDIEDVTGADYVADAELKADTTEFVNEVNRVRREAARPVYIPVYGGSGRNDGDFIGNGPRSEVPGLVGEVTAAELAEGAVPTARGETFAVQQPSQVRAVQAQQPIQNTTNVYVTVPNADPSATIRTIQRWARNNGALPIMRGH